MHKMIEKLSGKVGPLHMRPPQSGDLQMTPEISDVQSIAQEIMSFSHIVILTGKYNYVICITLSGAGVSVESNIPSFRGEGGFWTLRGFKFLYYRNMNLVRCRKTNQSV